MAAEEPLLWLLLSDRINANMYVCFCFGSYIYRERPDVYDIRSSLDKRTIMQLINRSRCICSTGRLATSTSTDLYMYNPRTLPVATYVPPPRTTLFFFFFFSGSATLVYQQEVAVLKREREREHHIMPSPSLTQSDHKICRLIFMSPSWAGLTRFSRPASCGSSLAHLVIIFNTWPKLSSKRA